MPKPTFSGTIRQETLEKADKIVKDNLVPGVNNRSALIEYALNKVFKEVFKEG
jgi:hypothetical protein